MHPWVYIRIDCRKPICWVKTQAFDASEQPISGYVASDSATLNLYGAKPTPRCQYRPLDRLPKNAGKPAIAFGRQHLTVRARTECFNSYLFHSTVLVRPSAAAGCGWIVLLLNAELTCGLAWQGNRGCLAALFACSMISSAQRLIPRMTTLICHCGHLITVGRFSSDVAARGVRQHGSCDGCN